MAEDEGVLKDIKPGTSATFRVPATLPKLDGRELRRAIDMMRDAMNGQRTVDLHKLTKTRFVIHNGRGRHTMVYPTPESMTGSSRSWWWPRR